jgi:hypothetical protein
VTASAAADACPAATPIRCSSGMCKVTAAECQEASSCANNQIYMQTCSNFGAWDDVTQMPTLHEVCTTKKAEGQFATITCADGSCVTDARECKLKGKCNAGERECGDGSCVVWDSFCPDLASCPGDSVRCDDGTCVPETTHPSACPASDRCPAFSPIRCPDGTCAESATTCNGDPDPIIGSIRQCPNRLLFCPSAEAKSIT